MKSISSCATLLKNTNKQEYNYIRKEINSSLDQKHKIQSYYHLDKEYCIFIGGTYTNDNNQNKDDILNSSSDMNDVFNEK